MLTLGLVGGIASGKSVVANCFRDLGALVLDADKAGHDVLREPDVIATLRQRWGDRVVDAHGQISRKEVAQIVFAPGNGPRSDSWKSSLTRGFRCDLQQEMAKALAQTPPPRVAVIDAALLFEAGWDKLCDKIVFIDAPRMPAWNEPFVAAGRPSNWRPAKPPKCHWKRRLPARTFSFAM